MRPLLSSPWLALFFRFVLGGIFLYAGVVKSQDPAGFAQAIYNYRILPGQLINPMAILLPWVEIVMGVAMLLGCWVPGASLLAMVLLGVFAMALGINLARGVDVDCGCFSTLQSGSQNTLWYFLRDILLLSLAFHVLIFNRQKACLASILRRGRYQSYGG